MVAGSSRTVYHFMFTFSGLSNNQKRFFALLSHLLGSNLLSWVGCVGVEAKLYLSEFRSSSLEYLPAAMLGVLLTAMLITWT